MLGMGHTESAFLSVVEGLPIPSSALIALIAALFLGTLVLRGQRQASSYAETPAETSALSDQPDIDQGANMSASTAAPVGSSSQPSPSSRPGPASQPQNFQLHWGRIAVTLIGVLSLLGAIVTGILAPLTAMSAVIPMVAGGLFLLTLLTLRVMAVVRRRSRRRQRVQSAIEEAMNPPQAKPWEAQNAGGLFDALSADGRGAGGPNSLQQIDEDGLPVGLERTFTTGLAGSSPMRGSSAEPVGPWQPRSVPRPKYLDLDKAERIEPSPLEAAAPAPSSNAKLTQRRFLETEPAVTEPAVTQPAEAEPAAQTTPAAQDKPAARVQPAEAKAPKGDSLNLDEVLRRRRA